MTGVRRLICRAVATGLPGLMLFAVQPAQASKPAGADGIPAGAVGFVQIDATELCRSPNLAFLTQIAGRVRNETSVLSLTKLGFDVTTLKKVTVVIPPVDRFIRAASRDHSPVVIAATFADAFRTDLMVSTLQTELKLVDAGNGVLVRGDDFALCVASEQTIVAGSRSGVAWWLKASESDVAGNLIQALAETTGQGAIRAACDLSQTQQLTATLPPGLRTLLCGGVVSAALDVDDKLVLDLVIRRDNEADASESAREIEQLITQAGTALTIAENAARRPLDNPAVSTSDALGTLAALAAIRQAEAYLSDIVLEQDGASVHVTAQVDNEVTSTIMICLTSIRAIGTHAQNEFESVAGQLDAR